MYFFPASISSISWSIAEVKEKYELVSTVDCMEIYVAEDNGVYKANHLEE